MNSDKLADALQKLLNGLATDGIAIDGFTDGWAALNEYRVQRLNTAMNSDKQRTAEVKLTKLEVDALLSAAGNGYSEGDYFCDADGSDSGYGGKRMDEAYQRAITKIRKGKNTIVCDCEAKDKEIEQLRKDVAELKKERGTHGELYIQARSTINYQKEVIKVLVEALEAISTNKCVSLSDLIYRVREVEGEGWEGPQVKAWSDAINKIESALSKAKDLNI